MNYIVYGKDDFRVAKFILESFGQNAKYIDSISDLERNLILFNQTSLFENSNTFVLKNLWSKLDDYLDEIGRSSAAIVIWEETDKLSQNSATFKNLVQHGFQVKEFPELSSGEVINWLTKSLQANQVVINHKTVRKLADSHGSNLRLLSNEVEKIRLYVKNQPEREITPQDLQLLSYATVEETVFDLLDGIGNRNLALIKKGIRVMYSGNLDEWHVFYLVTKHLKQLYQASLGLPLKIHPFVQKKLAQQNLKWTSSDILNKLHELLEIEFLTKKGRTKLKPELINWIFQQA